MAQSMTGFGRSKIKEGNVDLTVDIKTVNHRYLDIYVRMPRQFVFLEEKVRQKVSKQIVRGKQVKRTSR